MGERMNIKEIRAVLDMVAKLEAKPSDSVQDAEFLAALKLMVSEWYVMSSQLDTLKVAVNRITHGPIAVLSTVQVRRPADTVSEYSRMYDTVRIKLVNECNSFEKYGYVGEVGGTSG